MAPTDRLPRRGFKFGGGVWPAQPVGRFDGPLLDRAGGCTDRTLWRTKLRTCARTTTAEKQLLKVLHCEAIGNRV